MHRLTQELLRKVNEEMRIEAQRHELIAERGMNTFTTMWKMARHATARSWQSWHNSGCPDLVKE